MPLPAPLPEGSHVHNPAITRRGYPRAMSSYDDPAPRTRRATLALAAVFAAGIIAAGVGLGRSASGSHPQAPPVEAARVAAPAAPAPTAPPGGHRVIHEGVG